jgi:hypothetical protein
LTRYRCPTAGKRSDIVFPKSIASGRNLSGRRGARRGRLLKSVDPDFVSAPLFFWLVRPPGVSHPGGKRSDIDSEDLIHSVPETPKPGSVRRRPTSDGDVSVFFGWRRSWSFRSPVGR